MSHRKRISDEFGEPWADVVEGMFRQGQTIETVVRALDIHRGWLKANYPKDRYWPTNQAETYRGLTRKQWAEKLDMSYPAFCVRVNRLGWAEAVQVVKKQYRGRYNGLTIKQWAVAIGITYEGMLKRVREWGWERAVSTPVDRVRQSKHRNGYEARKAA